MATIQTEITLINLLDNGFAKKGFIKPEEIRMETVQAEADTGSSYLVITEELRQKLGLKIKEIRIAQITDGRYMMCRITEGVELRWKNRETIVQAIIIPDSKKIILGAIPMETLDLMVNPATREVTGAHGDMVEISALRVA